MMRKRGRRPNREIFQKEDTAKRLERWVPITQLGKKVRAGEVTSISQILSQGTKIMELEIIDKLLPDLESDFLLIGQVKGKFGGGKRRALRQTQKKTKEGNKPVFSAAAVVGNKNGYVGIGFGRSKETRPATDKAIRNAKLNLIQIGRGCGSWECSCEGHHALPFKVSGKKGSVRVTLMPAPKGTGLCVESEIKKILELAGIKDAWSKVSGQSNTKINLILAAMDALKKTSKIKIKKDESAKIKYGEL